MALGIDGSEGEGGGQLLYTLLYELCHHLDYEPFALAETFHAEWRRESKLLRQLLGEKETG